MSMHRLASAALSLLVCAAGATAQDILTLDLGEQVALELVRVPKGTFRQGSALDEPGRNADETPRDVTLSRPFSLGKYPVTRRQFARFVAESDYRTEAEKGPSGGFGFDGTQLVQRPEFTWRNPGFPQTDDDPVTLVTYDDAGAFCAWLGKKSGRTCGLPTEAQWEYACRAGTTTPYWNGRTAQEALEAGWYSKNAGKGTQPVGRKKANPFGLYDMGGNVWQWCRDWYGPYEPGSVTDPEETRADRTDPPRRVLRGGSWLKDVRNGLSAARFRSTPGTRNADVGFRVQVTAEPAAAAPSSNQVVLASLSVPDVTHSTVTAQAPLEQPAWARLMALLCSGLVCFGAVGLIIVVVVLLVRRATPSEAVIVQPSPRRSSYTPVRTVADGFWVSGLEYEAGTVVRYRCRVGGETRRGEFTTGRPGAEQFVYTGGTPSAVELLDVVRPGTTTGQEIAPVDMGFMPGSPDFVEDPTPPPFTGFPSAY